MPAASIYVRDSARIRAVSAPHVPWGARRLWRLARVPPAAVAVHRQGSGR